MPTPTDDVNIMIHEFDNNGAPFFDDDGDQMLGFYFQITDDEEIPISRLIGPYSFGVDAERAAIRACKAKDY